MPKQTYVFDPSRREFIKRTSVLAAATMAAPSFLRAQNTNSAINVACIGVGGKGSSDTDSAFNLGGNIVALCDVDRNRLEAKDKHLKDLAKKGNRTYDAKLHNDYRKLFDELGKSIDAVTVSTPDHLHAVIVSRALKEGKHVYCQKPLTQTVWEAREVRRLVAAKKVATQMGNQGSAGDGLRRAVEVIQGGVIGAPRELHVWSNRPVWPQGLDRPEGEDPVPANLNWDLWQGPRQARPYKDGVYHDFKWRGWSDYGTGALGDMACHTVNMPFRALKLGYPSVVECELASRVPSEMYPLTSRIRFEFPERDGMPPLKFWWYDGNPDPKGAPYKKTGYIHPIRPSIDVAADIVAMQGTLPGSGCLVVGDKGKIFSPDDYGSKFYIKLGKNEFKPARSKVDGKEVEHEALASIPQSIPRSPGHDKEWFEAIKGGPAPYSNFDIAAYLTEIILLGCVAMRVGVGRKLEWDGPNMKAINEPAAEKFVKREYRSGWEM